MPVGSVMTIKSHAVAVPVVGNVIYRYGSNHIGYCWRAALFYSFADYFSESLTLLFSVFRPRDRVFSNDRNYPIYPRFSGLSYYLIEFFALEQTLEKGNVMWLPERFFRRDTLHYAGSAFY